MTEADWWAATDPDPPFVWLSEGSRRPSRKSRLYAVACYRRIAHLHPAGPADDLLRVAEEVADGIAHPPGWAAPLDSRRPSWMNRTWTEPELAAASAAVAGLYHATDVPDDFAGWAYHRHAASFARVAAGAVGAGGPDEGLYQVRLLHDLFGPLPFRDVGSEPGWRTEAVVALAAGVYDDRAFQLMPVLADALDDAGCDQPDILAHCRLTDWEHVRGCWVIDLLLGRSWRDG